MHLPFDSIFTELWHLLDVSPVAGQRAVLAALLLRFFLLFIYLFILNAFDRFDSVFGIN